MEKLRGRLVPMGDHYRLEIPPGLAEGNGFETDVDVTVEHRGIEIRPAGWRAREGWEEEAAASAAAGDDDWDDDDWTVAP